MCDGEGGCAVAADVCARQHACTAAPRSSHVHIEVGGSLLGTTLGATCFDIIVLVLVGGEQQLAGGAQGDGAVAQSMHGALHVRMAGIGQGAAREG